jgi:type I restriction enzyme, R subunit
MQSPEKLAREKIDALLTKCGWLLQDYKKLDLSAARGVTNREASLKGCGGVDCRLTSG